MILYILKSVDQRSGQKESIVAYGKRAPWLRLLFPWLAVWTFPFDPKSSSHKVRILRREISYVEAVKDSEFYAKIEDDKKRRDEQKRLQDEAKKKSAEEAKLDVKPPGTLPEPVRAIPSGKKKVTMGTVKHFDTGEKP